MKLEILPSAWNDLADGFRFYSRQSAEVADCFRESLIADIESLRERAGFHRQIFSWHRLLARRFPFAIYYSIRAETVLVRAVLDCRRDPKWIQKRLR